MAELHLFDFDGTLFRSPGPPEDWKQPVTDWWNGELSLGQPYIPDRPGSEFWNVKVVSRARKSISDPDVWAIVVTGRPKKAPFIYRIPELLHGAGLRFDNIYLNPGTPTPPFKMGVMKKVLERHPNIDTVHIWENNDADLRTYVNFLERAGLTCIPHLIRTPDRPAVVLHPMSKTALKSIDAVPSTNEYRLVYFSNGSVGFLPVGLGDKIPEALLWTNPIAAATIGNTPIHGWEFNMSPQKLALAKKAVRAGLSTVTVKSLTDKVYPSDRTRTLQEAKEDAFSYRQYHPGSEVAKLHSAEELPDRAPFYTGILYGKDSLDVSIANQEISLDQAWRRQMHRRPGNSRSKTYVIPSGTVAFSGEQVALQKVLKHLLRVDRRVTSDFKVTGSERYRGQTIGDLIGEPRDVDVALTGRGTKGKIQPLVAYHGTSAKRWAIIKSRGLIPNMQGKVYQDLIPNYSDKNVYLALEPDEAENYATRQAIWDKSSAVVLKVIIRDPDKMVADEDWIGIGGSIKLSRPYFLTIKDPKYGRPGTKREVQQSHPKNALEIRGAKVYEEDAEFQAYYHEVIERSVAKFLKDSIRAGVFGYRGRVQARDMNVFMEYPRVPYPGGEDWGDFETYQKIRKNVQDKIKRPGRVAGLLEAPPKMVETIGGWVQAVVAANQMIPLIQNLESLKNRPDLLRKQYQPVMEAIAVMKRELRSGTSKTLFSAAKELSDWVIGSFGYGWFNQPKAADFQKLDEAKRKLLVAGINNRIQKIEERIEDEIGNPRLEQQAREEIARIKPFLRPGIKAMGGPIVERMFPVDLTGWRYGDADIRAIMTGKEVKRTEDVLEVLQEAKTPEALNLRKTVAQKLKDLRAHGAWKEIRVRLTMKADFKSAGAYWQGGFKVLAINVGTSLYPWQIENELLGSLYHELQHMSQDILREAFSDAFWMNPETRNRLPVPGMPPKRIMTPQYHQEDQRTNPSYRARGIRRIEDLPPSATEVHALDDIEFQTELTGAVREMKSGLNEYITKMANYYHRKPTTEELRQWFLWAVGASSKEMGLHPLSAMITWKRCALGKWRYAVKVLTKEFQKMNTMKIARLPTPESKAWDKDIKAREKHVADAAKALIPLIDALRPYAAQAVKMFPGEGKEAIASQGRQFVKLTKDLPVLNTYLDNWIGTEQQHPQAYSWRGAVLYRIRDHLTNPKDAPIRKTIDDIKKQADKGFEAIAMAISQGPLRKTFPEELRAFLPKNIVIDVDADGTIQKVTDRFENEHETLGVKIHTQHNIVRRYNTIVRHVKKDLESPDEMIRLAALVTAIIMETGIRPGKEGNHVVKTENGQDVDIETFGATTLNHSHVSFVRDFAQLEFPGKKGTTNIAVLSDPQILALLKIYVEQARKGSSGFVFVTEKGAQFTYADLSRYFRASFSDLSPTDFRKLKATETVLNNLRKEQASLYTRILDFAHGKTKDLKTRVTTEIVSSIQNAYEKAQKALSHESVEVTIRAYVNPEVVLRFLSQGGIEDTLEKAVLTGKPKLMFDPDVFVQQALRMQPAHVASGSTLQDILNELKDQINPVSGSAIERVANLWLTRF